MTTIVSNRGDSQLLSLSPMDRPGELRPPSGCEISPDMLDQRAADRLFVAPNGMFSMGVDITRGSAWTGAARGEGPLHFFGGLPLGGEGQQQHQPPQPHVSTRGAAKIGSKRGKEKAARTGRSVTKTSIYRGVTKRAPDPHNFITHNRRRRGKYNP